jgi:hypothetical protein
VSLAAAVKAGLAQLGDVDPRDQALADLAVAYAQAIDSPHDWGDVQRDPLAELGPKLLAALTALGMTPAARKGITGDKPAEKPRSPLDELRQKRAARAT